MSYKASLACAGAFAAAATLAGSAFAAEPAPAPTPVPVFTWTGIYLGGQIGYAWGNDDIFYNAYDPLTGVVFNPSAFNVPIVRVSPSGVIGGAHVGFNYQIDKPTASFVLGVEGSIDGTSLTRASRPALLPLEAAPCPRPRTRTSRVLFAAASASPGIGSWPMPQAASRSAASTPTTRS